MIYPPPGYIVLKIGAKHFPMQQISFPDESFSLHTISDTSNHVISYSKRSYAVAYCYGHRERRQQQIAHNEV